ncbi:MAG: sulfurtransferase TusA family protein [Planctomycetota bacterium]
MSETQQPIMLIPDNIRQDALAYRAQVEKFLRGETSPIAFRAYRVPMGIYEQRTPGRYMVRIRIGAGLVTSRQLERIAELSKKYGDGVVHITTRQDIQIHFIDIKDTPVILEGLLEVGLSSRGGGGNTVRNITACAHGGLCLEEVFDVSPYAVSLAQYLLQFGGSFNLPRKFKVVFSGCSDDCAFASVADMGFFAHIKNETRGFAVFAGGGLGPNPRTAVRIEEFIRDEEIFEVAEAVKQLFDKHGDRANKHKARLRYVLTRLGEKKFVELYKNERAELRTGGLPGVVPVARPSWPCVHGSEARATSDINSLGIDVLPEKVEGFYTVRLKLNLGNIPVEDLVKVAKIAEQFGPRLVRTTQLQDILITSIPGQNLDKVAGAVGQLSITGEERKYPKIVVCTGASTCKLGLCLSRNLAGAITKELANRNLSNLARDFVIRISGCPNSCGHHHVAHLGFEGLARRIGGRLMPFYSVLAGAQIREDGAKLAQRFGAIPAKRIPQFVAEALGDGPADKERLAGLVEKYGKLPDVVPEDYFFDFGQDEPFSLAGRGPGECGAGVMDVIRVDIDQAKDAIAEAGETQANKSEQIYKAIVAAARALLVVFGLEPKKDREVFSAFKEHLIKPGWVKSQTQKMLDDALDWRMGEESSIDNLLPEVEELIERIEALFVSLDSNLKFRVEPFKPQDNPAAQTTSVHSIDLRGVACPLNFVKAKLELEKINTGETLEILLDEGEPAANVPASFTEQGQDVIEIEKRHKFYCVRVRRKK